MIDQKPKKTPYGISLPHRAIFTLVWWPIEETGYVCWLPSSDRPHCREVTFTCLVILVRRKWEVHCVTPWETLPPMGRSGTNQLITALRAAIQDVLKAPVWAFPTDIIDWEGSNGV